MVARNLELASPTIDKTNEERKMSKNNKFIVKGKKSFPNKNSAFLAARGTPETSNENYTGGKPSAFLAARGEPAKGKATFNDSRYK